LPDYPGWPRLLDRFTRDWRTWKGVVGFHKISRIGVRYINRIDLPSPGPVIAEEEFITFNIRSPDELGHKHGYAAQARFRLDGIDGFVSINSGLVPSPLLGYVSFLLDIDLERVNSIPGRDEDLLAILNDFRLEKNRIFELCITDRAREVFDL
jgi:uncharacterized protein (TIGR04255 family)